ncbi:MAG: AhpC/TSA family protein [Bacteroidales bacterium]|nr:AhpC/TSA family protein [Bacteroidales bacterium]
MKRFTIILATIIAITAAVACTGGAKKKSYNIKGSGATDGAVVLLIDMLAEEQCNADMADADGNFSFVGEADANALLSVNYGSEDDELMFFNDGTPIELDIKEGTILKGSDLNLKLGQYEKSIHEMSGKISKKIEQYRAIEPSVEKERIRESIQIDIDSLLTYYKSILYNNLDNLLPAAFSRIYYSYMQGDDELEEELSKDHKFFKHPYAAKIKEEWENVFAQRKAAEEAKQEIIGQQFKELSNCSDPNGKPCKLSDFVGKGKWVLVDFWASWCGPCMGEMPNVKKAYQKYSGKGFNIVGVSFDDNKEAWKKAISSQGLNWVNISDLKGWQAEASSVYGVNSIPDNILVDPDGKVVARGLRGSDLQNKLAEIFD